MSVVFVLLGMAAPLPPIDKLHGAEDWFDWQMLMELLLASEGLSEMVKTKPSAEQLADKNSEDCRKDLRARVLIAFSIDRTLIKHIRTAKSAFEMWSALKRKVAPSAFTMCRKIDRFQQGKMPLTVYISEFRDLLVKHAMVSKPLPEMADVIFLFKNLRPELQCLEWIMHSADVYKTLENGSKIRDFEAVIEKLIKESLELELQRVVENGATYGILSDDA